MILEHGVDTAVDIDVKDANVSLRMI